MSVSVLYISYDGMTDPLGQSQVIPYLVGLSKQGYSFTILSCEKKQNFSENVSKIKAVLKENNIEWRPIFYTKNPPVLSTMYDLYKLKKLAAELHKEKNFSVVHCRSYITALAGMQLKKKFGIKFIFDMRGLWADERVDGKLWNLKNPVYWLVYKYFKKKETQFLQTADCTISLTHLAKDEILSWKSIDSQKVKIEVIPCCADLELFDKNAIQEDTIRVFKKELQIHPEDYILLYLGSIGTWYLLEEMMAFFSVMKKKYLNAKFLFVTKGEHDRILDAAEKYNIREDVLMWAASREEVPYLIALCNFSIFFILPSYSKIASSPTKQGELMAMGVPVICNAHVGDTDKIIHDYHSGILLNEFSVNAYEKAVDKMSDTFDEQQIINGAKDYFSLESGVNKYAEVYRSILA